jgi:two-component system, NtrC family, response regulator HydG
VKGCILLVDDNEEFLDSTKDVLEAEGHFVVTTNSGRTALELVESRAFDVVLMDIKMPGMNGVESFIEMKKCKPDVRVIMLTAYSIEELIRKALEEGVYAVLHKPLDMDRLLQLIGEIRTKGTGGMVLVADDNRELCDNLCNILEAEGYRVVLAYDGEEAVNRAEEYIFDVLLLDMKLPILNGLEAFRLIRSMQPSIIAILISGYAREMYELIHQTLNENAHSCLTKPLNMEQLLDLVQKLCRAKRNGTYSKSLDSESR